MSCGFDLCFFNFSNFDGNTFLEFQELQFLANKLIDWPFSSTPFKSKALFLNPNSPTILVKQRAWRLQFKEK